MPNSSYTNIKELIINQDDNLEEALLQYFYDKLCMHLNGKNTVDEINLEDILGFKETRLENALKKKLKKIQADNSSLNLLEAFEYLKQEENSWLKIFLHFLSRFFLLDNQEKLLNEILNDLPEEISTALQERIDFEKNQTIKNLDAFTEKANDAPLGEAVHTVKKYTNDKEEFFFIKDITYGFKGIIYKFLTCIGNEGIREVIGSAFYQAMDLNNSAKVGVIKDTRNQAVKIFSKEVGEKNDKICSLGQFLNGWDFDENKENTQQKIEKPDEWLNENQRLKQDIMKAHAVSMLIGNRDLKNDNIMIIKKPNGDLHCAPIDFGLSCHKVTDLNWVKNKHMHFDTRNMRHEDSLKLFNQNDYKAVLKDVVKEFNENKTEILESIYIKTQVLKEVGFKKYQYRALIQNIKSNVKTAEKICGISSKELIRN